MPNFVKIIQRQSLKINTMSINQNKDWRFRAFITYLRFINNNLMLRKRYLIGGENLPEIGEKFILVSNHQNSANDPINIAFMLPKERRIGFMTRADAFTWNATLARLIRWLGLKPAYRAGWEGAEALEKNFNSFDEVSDLILKGYPILVFPQGGHTSGHYFQPLTTGTARMAFHVAQQSDWKEDIKIVPVAHHYENFFSVRHDFILNIGKPISLKEYYEGYQNKPFTAMRRVRDLMYNSIHDMMLDEGEADYTEKDYLRNSLVNDIVAQGRNVPLPKRLEADKQFVADVIKSPNYDEILQLTRELMSEEKALGIDDYSTLYAQDSKALQLCKIVGSSIIDLLLLPLWIVSLWPAALCYRLPLKMLKEDIMFLNSYRYIVSVLALIPISILITVPLIGCLTGLWWLALLWVILFVPICQFAWWEWCHMKSTLQRIKVFSHLGDVAKFAELRNKIKNLIK